MFVFAATLRVEVLDLACGVAEFPVGASLFHLKEPTAGCAVPDGGALNNELQDAKAQTHLEVRWYHGFKNWDPCPATTHVLVVIAYP